MNQNQGINGTGERNNAALQLSNNYQSISKPTNQSFEINKPGFIGDPSRGRSLVNNSYMQRDNAYNPSVALHGGNLNSNGSSSQLGM